MTSPDFASGAKDHGDFIIDILLEFIVSRALSLKWYHFSRDDASSRSYLLWRFFASDCLDKFVISSMKIGDYIKLFPDFANFFLNIDFPTNFVSLKVCFLTLKYSKNFKLFLMALMKITRQFFIKQIYITF